MTIRIDKVAEDEVRCVYAFGGPDARAGRVAVAKATGDVEVLSLADDAPPPGPPFYLAAVVPRLQALHDAGSYPDADAWSA